MPRRAWGSGTWATTPTIRPTIRAGTASTITSLYGPDKPLRHDPPLLFHLGRDPSERFDIAGDHADVLADIAQEVGRHRATITPVKSQLEETIKSN